MQPKARPYDKWLDAYVYRIDPPSGGDAPHVLLDLTHTDPAEMAEWLTPPSQRPHRGPWFSGETVLIIVTLLSVMALGAAKIGGWL